MCIRDRCTVSLYAFIPAIITSPNSSLVEVGDITEDAPWEIACSYTALQFSTSKVTDFTPSPWTLTCSPIPSLSCGSKELWNSKTILSDITTWETISLLPVSSPLYARYSNPNLEV